MPAQQSSSVPDGPVYISIRRCLPSTATFCQQS